MLVEVLMSLRTRFCSPALPICMFPPSRPGPTSMFQAKFEQIKGVAVSRPLTRIDVHGDSLAYRCAKGDCHESHTIIDGRAPEHSSSSRHHRRNSDATY